MMDAAASLASTVESAQDSFDDLTANGNLSNTALQQAQVAAALTQGRINAAVAQVLAYQAVEQANRMQQAEIDRLGAARRVEGRAPPYERDGRCDAHGRVPESRPAPGGAPLQDPFVLHGRPSFRLRERLSMQLVPPQSHRSERPGQIPADQLQDFKGSWTSCSTPWSAAPRPTCSRSATSSGAVSRRSSSLERAQDRVQRNLRALVPRACRARDRDPPDAAPLLQRPDPGRGLHVSGHGRGRRIWLQNLFISDVVSVGYTEMTALVQAVRRTAGRGMVRGSLMTLVTEGVSVFFSSLVALMMGVPLVLGLVALFCLTYAQVIWAQVALAIVILLGPVFIPWLLFEPLAFLFWGWFRTLMVYTLYGVVAGAILRVFMGVGMGYVTTYTGALMGTGSSDPAELGLWVVVLLPLVVSGLMAGMKVGELAAMLVSGSGIRRIGIHGARGARRRTPQRCREPGPPPNPRGLKRHP